MMWKIQSLDGESKLNWKRMSLVILQHHVFKSMEILVIMTMLMVLLCTTNEEREVTIMIWIMRQVDKRVKISDQLHPLIVEYVLARMVEASSIGWVKNDFSSQTDFFVCWRKLSHFLCQKHDMKPKIEKFQSFFHPVKAVQSFTT